MFSRSHYEVIAKVIKKSLTNNDNINYYDLIDNFIKVFENDNSRFNPEKFQKALKKD